LPRRKEFFGGGKKNGHERITTSEKAQVKEKGRRCVEGMKRVPSNERWKEDGESTLGGKKDNVN